MIVEQLNVECNHQAKTYVLNTNSSSVAFGNPDIPEARPNIQIQGKIVCRKLLPALRDTLSAPAYCSYLKTKLNWNNNDIKEVNWPVLQTALDTFPPNDQRRLLLFVNDKLPLRASKAHPHFGSPLCPSCQRDEEDLWHFLECTHSDQRKLFQELHNNLNTITQKLSLHPCLLTSIWLGLTAIRHDTSYPEIDNDLLLQLRSPVQQQIRLGWDQMYQGRTSRQWATAIDQLHPTLPINGNQVMVKIITTIWTYILDLWKLRNAHLHQHAPQMDLPNYQQAMISLYEQRNQLPPEAQTALYRQPLKTVLELPTPRLQNWTERGYTYFYQQLKAAKCQAILHTLDIRNYFRPTTQLPHDLQPP